MKIASFAIQYPKPNIPKNVVRELKTQPPYFQDKNSTYFLEERTLRAINSIDPNYIVSVIHF
jgi:hypothetical protein